MRFFIQTLGCKINQYESQALREAWLARGWLEAASPEQADVTLVHTCAVTAGAVADSRGAVRRAGRLAPGARLLVAGCAAQVEPEAFRSLPGVETVVMQRHKPALKSWPGPGMRDAGTGTWPDFAISSFTRARPVLKVQDGCSHRCTYCIVPLARGGPRSRPYAGIEAEAVRLLQAGHREIILSGVNLGQFVLEDRAADGFWTMLARLEAALAPRWAGRARFRLSSLDPGMLGPRALETLAASRMTCPHLHLSLQSADPGVLAAMGRGHYEPDAVLAFLDALRRVWPETVLGADILTGFPGESEEAFRRTLEFMDRAGLGYAHVFPYSRRPGTPASQAKDQTPHADKKRRAAALRQRAAILEEASLLRVAALPELTMAVEDARRGRGASQYYHEVSLEGPSPVAAGRLLAVRPVGVRDGRVLAEPLA